MTRPPPRKRLPQQPMLTLAPAPDPPPGRRSRRPSVDFVERARPFALELVGGRGHYERVVRAVDGGAPQRLDRDREPQGADGRGPPRRARPAAHDAHGGRVRRAPTDRSWTCSTSWRARGVELRILHAAPPSRPFRATLAQPPAAGARRLAAARLSARALQGGRRRRRLRLRRQRQLDGRGPGRQGDGPAQLRARLRGRRRRPARSRAGALRSGLARRRVQGLQAARRLPGALDGKS